MCLTFLEKKLPVLKKLGFHRFNIGPSAVNNCEHCPDSPTKYTPPTKDIN
jgi:hypothetical protein